MRTAKWHAVLSVTLALVLFLPVIACGPPLETNNGTVPTSIDSTPPTIDSINISEITESSAIISWQTNEEATSQVQFGKTAQNLNTVLKSGQLTTAHSITIKPLEIGACYHFRVISSDANGNQSISATGSFLTPRPVGCAIGNRAPDFTLKDINGKDVSLSDSLGKFVVLNFWYAGCWYDDLEWQYWQEGFTKWPSDNVTLLTVHRNRTTKPEMIQWIRNHHYSVPALYDDKGVVSDKYCIVGVPTSFFIAPDGSIKYICMGAFKSYQEIEDTLSAIFESSKKAKLQMYYVDANEKPASNVQETCMLEFNLEGPELNYILDAHLLKPKTDYSLIYYSSPWPTINAAMLVGSATTDGLGNLKLTGSTNLGMNLPDTGDPSHPTGAKLLLVLSADYDTEGKIMKQWHPDKYLWPGFQITYIDTDIP
jgi:peroxiredoxin